MLDIKRLISYEFFPSELPCCFSNSDIQENFLDLENEIKNVDIFKVEKSYPLLFTVYKNENARRRVALPNIYQYFLLVKILYDNEIEIKKIYDLSKYSLTKPNKKQNVNEDIAYTRISNSIAETRSVNEKLFQDNSICLKTDISNFFDSIYTHSISWAIHTKKTAKQKKGDHGLLGNKIDRCLQLLNDKQTHGVLVGNAASRLISEIILCRIDNEIHQKFPRIDMCRYVDDYSFYIKESENGYSANTVISFLRNQLLDYDLLLNEAKTKTLESPFVLCQNGIDEIKIIKINNPYDYYNMLILIFNKYKDVSVLKYGLRVIADKIERKNFGTLFPMLINLWVKFPFLAEYILPIIYKNNSLINFQNKKILKKSLTTILEEGIEYKHEVEVVWGILGFISLGIKITENIFKKIMASSNDFAIIMVLTEMEKNKEGYYSKELIKLENRIIQEVQNEWSTSSNPQYMYSSKWLLIYELVVKGITTNLTIIDYVKQDKFFLKMYNLKVDFYKNDLTPAINKKANRNNEVVSTKWLKTFSSTGCGYEGD